MGFQISNVREQLNFPFGLAVQKGLVEDFTGVGMFGYNDAVGSSFETIWTGGGTYSYPSSSLSATVTSSNTVSDNGGTVELVGLDADYNQQTVTATIGGSATTETWSRIFSARLKTATTGTANVGVITVSVDGTSVAIIPATYGGSLASIYTIPANKRGYIMSASIGMSKQKEVESKLMIKQISNGNVWNTIGYQTTFGAPIYRLFEIPLMVEEKTDIEIRAKADATTSISASFSIYLEDYD